MFGCFCGHSFVGSVGLELWCVVLIVECSFVVMLFGNKTLVICGFCLMGIYLTLLSCDL